MSLEQALRDKGLLVVDVRSAQEVQSYGKMESAVNIPIDRMVQTPSLLGDDKSRPILFYCAKGIRSAQAASLAKQLGYGNSFSTTDALSAEKLVKEASDEPRR
jgi:phage shock protein E